MNARRSDHAEGRRLRPRPLPEHRAPPVPGLRPPGRLAAAGRGARRARARRPLHRRGRSRLLHPDHHHRRRRVPAVPARARPGGRHRREAHAAGARDLHPPGRRRHGLGGARRGAARRRARRVDHLPHAQQRRVRRHRRADDRGDDRRPTHQDEPRRSLPQQEYGYPIPCRRHRGDVPRRRVRRARRGRQAQRQWRGPGATCARRSRRSSPARGSRWSRCSPCARPAGPSPPTRARSTSATRWKPTFPPRRAAPATSTSPALDARRIARSGARSWPAARSSPTASARPSATTPAPSPSSTPVPTAPPTGCRPKAWTSLDRVTVVGPDRVRHARGRATAYQQARRGPSRRSTPTSPSPRRSAALEVLHPRLVVTHPDTRRRPPVRWPRRFGVPT